MSGFGGEEGGFEGVNSSQQQMAEDENEEE
jgi:hypothetical protein